MKSMKAEIVSVLFLVVFLGLKAVPCIQKALGEWLHELHSGKNMGSEVSHLSLNFVYIDYLGRDINFH